MVRARLLTLAVLVVLSATLVTAALAAGRTPVIGILRWVRDAEIEQCLRDGRAAAFLGASASLGTLEPGKAADLAVLGEDPLASVTAVGRIELVLRDGRVVWPR